MSELKKLEDIKKAISLGGEIKELEKVVKDLESKKRSLEMDKERTIRETDEYKRDINKKILKDREDIENEIMARETNLKQIEKDLTNREKTIILREKEGRDLDAEIQAFNKKKRSFSAERKSIDLLKSEYIDREHKANLTIEQYKKMIGELPDKKKR